MKINNITEALNSTDTINYNVDEYGVLHIYLGRNVLIAELEDCGSLTEEELKELVDNTLYELGYDWNEDGTITSGEFEVVREKIEYDKESAKKYKDADFEVASEKETKEIFNDKRENENESLKGSLIGSYPMTTFKLAFNSWYSDGSDKSMADRYKAKHPEASFVDWFIYDYDPSNRDKKYWKRQESKLLKQLYDRKISKFPDEEIYSESLKEEKEEDKLETFEDKMDFLAKDEQEAIDGYDKVIALLDKEADAFAIEQLTKIKIEEEAHKKYLEEVKTNRELEYTEPLEHEELPEVELEKAVEIEENKSDNISAKKLLLKSERDELWNKGSEITNEDFKKLISIRKELGDEFYTESLTKASLKKLKESKSSLYIYQFPPLTGKDRKELKKYDLEYLGKQGKKGFQPGDSIVKGTLKNLRKYSKEYLAYELVKDYLCKAEDFNDEFLESLKESMMKETIYNILGWLANHKEYYSEFKKELGEKNFNKELTELSIEDVKKWISNHKELKSEYDEFFKKEK